MGQAVLVFVSHSSEDKESIIEPIVKDLEDCFINIWLDKRKILPGDNLRKSIFRDGLDKADVVLIFFTQQSLKSSWVDREVKHVLREEHNRGNNFDLNKIISIFDSQDTYEQIRERYPELTDDLLHLMPENYNRIQLGQLISAIWSKYLSLQGGDIETQKQILAKDRELFQKDKAIQELSTEIKALSENNSTLTDAEEFKKIFASGKLDGFIQSRGLLLNSGVVDPSKINNSSEAMAFGLVEFYQLSDRITISKKGKDFFKWFLLNAESEP